MPHLASDRLVRYLQRATQALSYTDMAIYYAPASGSTGLDSMGQPGSSATGVYVDCSFHDSIRNQQSSESWTPSADIAERTAEIRLGPDVIVPVKGGKFKLIRKYENPVDLEHMFEIIDIRDRGRLGYVCALKKSEL